MRPEDLDHIVRAAGNVINEDEILVAGSQAALAQFPEGLPKLATLSVEADLAALDDPDDAKAMQINGAIGEDTIFHEKNGYYAEGIGRALLVLPTGWEERALRVMSRGQRDVTGIYPEIHDLAIAKLAAGRDKDFAWAQALFQSGHLKPATLLERANATALKPHQKRFIVAAVSRAAPPGRWSRRNIRRLTELLEQPESTDQD